MMWIPGAKGMLGRQLCAELAKANVPHVGTDLEVDITDLDSLARFASDRKIAWIINCSAYTAVDKAESEPEKARAINAVGAGNLASVAERLDVPLVHFSLVFVYDGTLDRPYRESDPVNPLSVYGMTKLEGERLIQAKARKVFIIRISWLYGIHGGNFVKTMLRLFAERDEVNVVNDQVGSPTYAAGLAENITRLARESSSQYGLYLYTDDGYLSWYEFAVAIKELALEFRIPIKDVRINPIPSEKYPTPAVRPRNSRFDKAKVGRELGFAVLPWKDNLRRYFEAMRALALSPT